MTITPTEDIFCISKPSSAPVQDEHPVLLLPPSLGHGSAFVLVNASVPGTSIKRTPVVLALVILVRFTQRKGFKVLTPSYPIVCTRHGL